jgi:hypothetical protein
LFESRLRVGLRRDEPFEVRHEPRGRAELRAQLFEERLDLGEVEDVLAVGVVEHLLVNRAV